MYQPQHLTVTGASAKHMLAMKLVVFLGDTAIPAPSR